MIHSAIAAAVLIYGLPQTGVNNPLTQLTEIDSQLKCFITPNTTSFDWSRRYSLGFRDSCHLLQRGNFGKTLADDFNRWFGEDEIIQSSTGRNLLVVAYSVGGLILYKWLTRPETTDEDRGRIALAITIASPYRCLLGRFDIEMPDSPGRKLQIRGITEPAIKRAHIIQKLPADRLKVVLAHRDITVQRNDSTFLPYYQHRVEEHIVPETRHATVNIDEQTSTYVQAFCQSLSADPSR